jgi:RNA polymerase sigma-70 factor (ECF subfamily)
LRDVGTLAAMDRYIPASGETGDDRAARDLEIVREVLGGRTERFRELVVRYQNMIAGIAWRAGCRREDVEDVVSEVLLKVYGNLHQFRPDHAFSTWLYKLTANHVIDRSRRARKERGRTEMPEQLEDHAQGAEDALETDERHALVREALRHVDERYREVMHLVYVEGLKVEETARVLGAPEGTVKTRLMRGREALRKILMRRNPEHFPS